MVLITLNIRWNECSIEIKKENDDLVEVRGLDRSKFLDRLSIDSYNSIEMLDLSELKHLNKVNASHHQNLVSRPS